MTSLTNKSSKTKQNQRKDSFLEAFRDLGVGNSPALGKQELFNKEAALEKEYRSRLRQSEMVRKQELVLFTRQQKEAEQKVLVLQDEIKQLAQATGELAKEAEIASMQISQDVGAYHVSFFEKLIKSINALRRQIRDSSFWLASWNKKSQKRNYYWGQYKKSGSKFMLSADRYMSTQAG